MPQSSSNSSCVSLVRTEQSRPPENSTATLVLSGVSPSTGGLGIFLTRRRSDSLSCRLNARIDGAEVVRQAASGGPERLNTPSPDVYISKFFDRLVGRTHPRNRRAT